MCWLPSNWNTRPGIRINASYATDYVRILRDYASPDRESISTPKTDLDSMTFNDARTFNGLRF